MALLYQCPHCKAVLEAEESVAGSRVDCPECGQEFVAAPLGAPVSTEREKRSLGFREAWGRKWTRWYWTGRASRREFWLAALAQALEWMAVMFLSSLFSDPANIIWIYILAAFVPTTCLCIRRLHDAGHTGLWIGLVWALCIYGISKFMEFLFERDTDVYFIPLWVVGIILLVFMLQPGDKGRNKYGEEP